MTPERLAELRADAEYGESVGSPTRAVPVADLAQLLDAAEACGKMRAAVVDLRNTARERAKCRRNAGMNEGLTRQIEEEATYYTCAITAMDADMSEQVKQRVSDEYDRTFFKHFCEGSEAAERGDSFTQNPHELNTLPWEAWDDGWKVWDYARLEAEKERLDAALKNLRRYMAVEMNEGEGPRIGLAFDGSIMGFAFDETYQPWELLEMMEKWLHEKIDGALTKPTP